MGKLEDTLGLFQRDIERHYGGRTVGKTLDGEETVQRIKEIILELVGEDEVQPASGPQRNGIVQGLRRARNRLRVELRKKINEL